MKYIANVFLTGLLCTVSSTAIAAEWVSVTQNDVGDRFFIDTSSILRKDDNVWYWEYREFPDPNNVFLEEKVDKPIHGVVLNWSANCTSKTQRLRQVTAYDKEREVVKRVSYGDTGDLTQPKAGSSTVKVLTYACTPKQGRTTNPATATDQSQPAGANQ